MPRGAYPVIVAARPALSFMSARQSKCACTGTEQGKCGNESPGVPRLPKRAVLRRPASPRTAGSGARNALVFPLILKSITDDYLHDHPTQNTDTLTESPPVRYYALQFGASARWRTRAA
ncbi:hypothetical protein KCP73_05855 [Salmonella enterica subsp. enterica]|nr:hypothetical protein KCP73_05855 [Salmonella enterica subsp. enterica]